MSAKFGSEIFWFSAIGTKPGERQDVWIANRDMTTGNSSEQSSAGFISDLPDLPEPPGSGRKGPKCSLLFSTPIQVFLSDPAGFIIRRALKNGSQLIA